MPAFRDITNEQFGRLVVLGRAGKTKQGGYLWRCVCNCGNQTVAPTSSLRNGHTKSCGCLQKDLAKQRATKHGMRGTREYNSWCQMRNRCHNKNNHVFQYYGGRGIAVCERWNSFESFLVDMGARPKNTSIDRIDNDGDYNKENCRWATQKMQSRNMRSNRMLDFNGVTLCLTDMARKHGLAVSCLTRRLNMGWSVEKSLTTPSIIRKIPPPEPSTWEAGAGFWYPESLSEELSD